MIDNLCILGVRDVSILSAVVGGVHEQGAGTEGLQVFKK